MPRLRDGTKLAAAEQRIRDLADRGRNVAAGSAGQSLHIHQNSFLAWVSIAESQLRNIFVDPTAWELLYEERYWRIHDLTVDRPRGWT